MWTIAILIAYDCIQCLPQFLAMDVSFGFYNSRLCEVFENACNRPFGWQFKSVCIAKGKIRGTEKSPRIIQYDSLE